MKKYFNQIISGNALDQLKKLSDDFINLVITSPPGN